MGRPGYRFPHPPVQLSSEFGYYDFSGFLQHFASLRLQQSPLRSHCLWLQAWDGAVWKEDAWEVLRFFSSGQVARGPSALAAAAAQPGVRQAQDHCPQPQVQWEHGQQVGGGAEFACGPFLAG